MSCDVGKVTEGLENELWSRLSDGKVGEWAVMCVKQWKGWRMSCDMSRVAICPVFPGHVLFFRVENSVRADFFNLTKCPGFWTNYFLLLFPINSMLWWRFWCFNFLHVATASLRPSELLLFKILAKSLLIRVDNFYKLKFGTKSFSYKILLDSIFGMHFSS